ncbi:hypothetical protein CF326_g5348 [Tilletia indica]|nr:hypothetical protein CF326_g5348 [Tilletia indica]
MAFLAPAIRWPDALQSYLPDTGLFNNSPDSLHLFISTALGFLIITTALTYTFRRTPRAITAQPVSIGSTQGDAGNKGRRRRKMPLSLALVGPVGAGKTALYRTLLYGHTPHTQTSQQSSSVNLVISSESGDLHELGAAVGGKVNVALHDLPGHPRLRPLGKHVQIVMGADVLLFCVDTVSVLGGGGSGSAASGAGGTETFSAAVDYLHSTLMSLARQRLSSTTKTKNPIPPAFAILLTRADLSPLLASSSKEQGSDEAAQAARAKRHQAASTVLLSRARTALETELRKKRAADVDLVAGSSSASAPVNQAQAKIGGMSEVARGEGEGVDGGIVKRVLGLLGLAGSSKGSSRAGLGGEDDEEKDEGGEEGVPDYYLGTAGGSSTNFSLDKLDPEVVQDGEVSILLSTVGRERGWEAKAVSEGSGVDGLGELKKWIVGLV